MGRAKQQEQSLPLFEGYEVPKARIDFSGGLDLDLSSQLDRELLDALRWGRMVELTIEVGSKAWRVAGQVDTRAYVFKFEDAERVPTTKAKIVVDSRMIAPGELRSREEGVTFGGPMDGAREPDEEEGDEDHPDS